MDPALAACRFAHYVSSMIAFGASAYAWAFAPASLCASLSPRLRRLVLVASAFALLSALAWLALEAAAMGGDMSFAYDPDAVLGVLTDTQFGHVWQGRLCVALALVAALALERPARWATPTALAAALVASLALVDHGAMQSGLVGAEHRANDALHLLAAAGWLGGLIPFILCLDSHPDVTLRAEAMTAMKRFSTVGHVAVVAILATGAVNIALTTQAAPWPPDSPYRALLLIKIAIVGAMIGVAIFNRYVLVRRAAMAELRLNSLIEVGAGAIVLALVSVFGLMDPR